MCEIGLTCAGEPARLARQLREQLHEMMAASQALESALEGKERALSCLAVLNRGMFRQLRLCREYELQDWYNDPDEVRLTLGAVDLVGLCRTLVERVDQLTAPMNIRAEFRSSRTVMTTAADQRALEDMLLTLIAGAVKTIEQNGVLLLELERRERSAVLILSGEGGSMDGAKLLAMFEPDEDGAPWGVETPEAQRSRDLMLAQQIAALHGGILVLEGQEDRGPRLRISLPLRELAESSLSLNSLRRRMDTSGGWDRVRIALADCLPVESFRPEELRK